MQYRTYLLFLASLCSACSAQDASTASPAGQKTQPDIVAPVSFDKLISDTHHKHHRRPADWSVTESAAWGTVTGTSQWVQRALPTPPVSGATDYSVDVTLSIDTSTTVHDPVHQVGAFSYYNNQEDLGGYEAAIVLRDDGTDRYRVQISSRWGEALLWSTRGGILQVRPFSFAAGQSYALSAAAQGDHITLSVNGQGLLDVFDRTVPLTTGTAALASKEGVVTFAPATLASVKTAAVSDPGYAPNFSLRTWKGLSWGFDGDEPIFALGIPPEVAVAFLPERYDCVAFEVKLVPGYTAQVYLPWYATGTSEPFSAGALLNLNVLSQGASLHLQLQCQDPVTRPDLGMLTDVVLSYDTASAAYRYDMTSTLTVPAGGTLRVAYPIDVTDVGFFNGVPSSSTQGTQWPQPHPQSVYLAESGALYREPHNHANWYPGYGTTAYYQARANYLTVNGGFWSAQGDPIANPRVELVSVPKGGSVESELCWWAYDLHVRWDPGGPQTVGPGAYTTHWHLVSMPGTAATTLLGQAGYATAGDLLQTWLLYTGGIGHVESFDKVVPRASPFGEYPWGDGSLQDPTGGGGGGPAMLLSGPNFAGSSTGSDRYAEAFLANTTYEVSAMVKIANVQGEGPGILFNGQGYFPGLTGTADWQRIGFLTQPGAQGVINFTLQNSGSGSAWFDDFEIRAVDPGGGGGLPAPYPQSSPVPIPLLSMSNPQPGISLAWDARSEIADGTVLDQSGHGSHGTLVGASWTNDGSSGNRVVQIPGNGAYVLMRGNPGVDLGAQATLTLWLDPGAITDPEVPVVSGGLSDTDLWEIQLQGAHPPYYLSPMLPGVNGRSAPIIVPGQWTHVAVSSDGQNMVAYVNGQQVVAGPSVGQWLLPADSGYLRVGTGLNQGKVLGSYVGNMTRVRVYPQVLTPAQVQAEAAAGPWAM